ncbi:MAG: hypothetical protein CMH55_03810 [Myxococcales bacterium]|nr:hypothetical protein [Myxococcales bacterium]
MKPGGETELLILGGGINGVAIARDAVQRGLKVQLIEAKDLCWGTSAGSTRLIHGGLRYLEHFEFGLVRESLRERKILSHQRPWRVQPIELFLAVQNGDPHWASTLLCGLWMYQAIALRWPFGADASSVSTRWLRKHFPHLRSDGVKAALRYFDCQVRYPERLVMELWNEAAAGGARLEKGHRVETLLRHDGRVVGAELDDGRCVYGQVVVNATGHWVDALGQRSFHDYKPQLVTTRGSHIMLPRRKGMPRSGLYTYARSDGRAFFTLPWGDSIWVGTTDIFHTDPDVFSATEDEVSYLLNEANQLLPGADYQRNEIILTRCGVRPLARGLGGRGKKAGSVSRAHRVLRPKDPGGCPGMISVLGGKLTTHLSLAEEVVDAACALLGRKLHCRSADDLESVDGRPLPPLPEPVQTRLEAVYGPYTHVLADLIERDPSLKQPLLPGLPLIRAEVAYAFVHEAADNLDDFYHRRCMLTTEDLPWTDKARPLAVAVGGVLGWDPARSEAELERWVGALAHHDPLNAKRVQKRL